MGSNSEVIYPNALPVARLGWNSLPLHSLDSKDRRSRGGGGRGRELRLMCTCLIILTIADSRGCQTKQKNPLSGLLLPLVFPQPPFAAPVMRSE